MTDGRGATVVSVQTPTSPPSNPDTTDISGTPTTDGTTHAPALSGIRAYGQVTLRTGEKIQYPQLSLQLVRVFDESRCPEGVTCIWAGTLKADVRSASRLGTSTQTVELGSTVSTESETITFLSATPYPKEGKSIAEGEYVLTFAVARRVDIAPPLASPPAQSACYVGGCSGEVCSDQKDIATNCMYSAEFACYKTAKCERQANKQCGWSDTATLRACLQNPPKM